MKSMPSTIVVHPEGKEDKQCGCTGIRWCFICRPKVTQWPGAMDESIVYYYCCQCGDKAWRCEDHESHSDDSYLIVKGLFVAEEAITSDQEKLLSMQIDKYPWKMSQSGRLKQDFGPKVNFRKRKVKIGEFRGFPQFAHDLLNNLIGRYPVLDNFVPVELCHLEYKPDRGSCIDPHLDDMWLWGERLVTVNLLSSTCLTLTPIEITPESGRFEIRIPMPTRSLIVLSSQARYELHHSIRREHILSRRIAITFREATPLFMPGGELYESIGRNLVETGTKVLLSPDVAF